MNHTTPPHMQSGGNEAVPINGAQSSKVDPGARRERRASLAHELESSMFLSRADVIRYDSRGGAAGASNKRKSHQQNRIW